jgi:hypothetical protein
MIGASPVSTAPQGGQDAAADPRTAIVEVRFSYEGLQGSLSSAPDCPGRRNGTAVMTGQVAGLEDVPSDEDIVYTGTMQLKVDIDLCEATRDAGSSEDRLCFMRVVGSGPVAVELTVYADDRGGYVTAERAKGPLSATVTGNCGQDANVAEQDAFPDNSMANPFNGTELPLPTGPLQVVQYQEEGLTVDVVRIVRRP